MHIEGQRPSSLPSPFGNCSGLQNIGSMASLREENDLIFTSKWISCFQVHSNRMRANWAEKKKKKKQRAPLWISWRKLQLHSPWKLLFFPHFSEFGGSDYTKFVSRSAWLNNNTLAKRNTFFLWFLLPAKCQESFKFKQSMWRRIDHKSKDYCLRNSSTFPISQQRGKNFMEDLTVSGAWYKGERNTYMIWYQGKNYWILHSLQERAGKSSLLKSLQIMLLS